MLDKDLRKLDLYTLESIQFSFQLHSDMSCDCNGYRSLCEYIKEAKKLQENDSKPHNFPKTPPSKHVIED